MAGPLKNARHERFAQERAKGLSVDAAYAEAGFRPHRGNAHRLSTIESVAARIAELQSKTAEKATTTAADIARQLDEDRDFAKQLKQVGPMVSATMGKAKVLGLIVDRQRHSFDFSGLSDDDLDALEMILAKSSVAR